MGRPEDWVETDEYGYSPSRWDPDEYQTECLDCGGTLQTGGDRAGVLSVCPECDVYVFCL